MKSPLVILAILSLTAFSAFAQVPEALVVRIEVQMVSMPLEKGLPLIPNLRDTGSIEGAFSQIQKMIAAGEATLNAWPEVVTKSGQRAVTEDIEEVRYASDYVPHPPATGTEKPAPAPAEPPHNGAPVPTEFETRNVGATLEVEPVIGPDGKTIDLNLVPQYVLLRDFVTAAKGRDFNGHDWIIEQPRFCTAKTTTSLTLLSGQRVLLAEFRGPEGSDQIQFFILKAEVKVLGGGGSRSRSSRSSACRSLLRAGWKPTPWGPGGVYPKIISGVQGEVRVSPVGSGRLVVTVNSSRSPV